MERRFYEELLQGVKNDIIAEIRELIPRDSEHHFKKELLLSYIDADTNATEWLSAVKVLPGGDIVFIVRHWAKDEESVVEQESVFDYSIESFIDILDRLKKEVREEKLSRLRKMVTDAGGRIDCDGSFGFHAICNGEYVEGIESKINSIFIDDGKANFGCTFSGEEFQEDEKSVPIDELDKLIAYVESQAKKKFSIRVSGVFSRHFEIEATSYEEALKEAKKDWETNPLSDDDLDGIHWDGYQYDKK